MKKLFSTIIILTILSSCASEKLVKKSSVCIANSTETKIWFRDNHSGALVYSAWQKGYYGKAEVFLVDSVQFEALSKKIN